MKHDDYIEIDEEMEVPSDIEFTDEIHVESTAMNPSDGSTDSIVNYNSDTVIDNSSSKTMEDGINNISTDSSSSELSDIPSDNSSEIIDSPPSDKSSNTETENSNSNSSESSSEDTKTPEKLQNHDDEDNKENPIPEHHQTPQNKVNNNQPANPYNRNQQGHQRPNLGVPPKNNGNNESLPNTTSERKNNNSSKKGDVGSRNLKNSLANKAKNLRNILRRKKQKTDESSSSESSDESSTPLESIKDKVRKVKRIILIFKIAIIAFVIFFIIVIFLALILAITGANIAKSIPIIGPSSYDSDSFQSSYEKGTEEYDNEVKYYKKLNEVKKEYDKEHNDELKTSYIHSILLYKYYITETHDKNSKGKEIPIDFSKLTSNVDTVLSIMKESAPDGVIDYDKNGAFYVKLKDNQFFKDYYKEVLEDRKDSEVMDEIFDFADEIDNIEIAENTVVTEQTKVTISENKSTNKTVKKLSITDYLSESIYAQSDSISNPETVKAYTIAFSTNVASQNKNLTIDSNNASMTNQTCSIKLGCSYNKDGILVDGPGESSNKNNIYYNGKYYYRRPLTDEEKNALNKNVNNVFGNVLVNSDGTYPNLDINKITGLGDGDYKAILSNSYGNLNIKNIGENSYILDASYGEKKLLVDVIFYDQGNYSQNKFCGLKKETISSSGCGITSMAMVVSTYEKSKQYSPIWANDIALKNGQCGAGRGTDYSHFKYVAKKMGYKTPIFYTKNKSNGWKLPKTSYNNILKNLAKGNLVIVNVTKGHFTSGGHYMVLGGIDPNTKKVYVYDPNNKSNSRYRKTGNGWWSFNDIIAPESKAFIIFEKKG